MVEVNLLETRYAKANKKHVGAAFQTTWQGLESGLEEGCDVVCHAAHAGMPASANLRKARGSGLQICRPQVCRKGVYEATSRYPLLNHITTPGAFSYLSTRCNRRIAAIGTRLFGPKIEMGDRWTTINISR
jgi:hypothetical protein